MNNAPNNNPVSSYKYMVKLISLTCVILFPLVMFMLGRDMLSLNLKDKYLWLGAGIFILVSVARHIYYKMQLKSVSELSKSSNTNLEQLGSGIMIRSGIMEVPSLFSVAMFSTAKSYNLGLMIISVLSGLSILLFIRKEDELMALADKK